MKVPAMTDIRNDAIRRTVLIVFLVPSAVIATIVAMGEAVIEVVRELPYAVQEVWRSQK